MSEIEVNYRAETQPSRIGVRFGLRFAGATLQARVTDYQDFVVVLEPTGNVSELVLSGIAWPLAQSLGLALPTLARASITGYSFDLLEIQPSTHQVGGEAVTVRPGNLSLTSHGDMLMVEASLDIA